MGVLDRLRNTVPFGAEPADPQIGNDEFLGLTPPEPDPGMVRPRIGMSPLGQSGRANFYGLPQWDELNPKLIGARGLTLLDEMYRTDAHVRRLVLAAWSPIVAGTWTLEPYGAEEATDLDREIADTIWWLLTQWMSPNFFEHLHTLGPLLLRSGFTPFEEIWATTQYQGKGRTLLAPRKLDVRLPKTIWRWWQDDFGELTHIGQLLPNKPDVVIPATELVYYRIGAEGDNWMGTSLLRHAYKHWFLKDKLERIDAIGQERKAVGLPVLYHSPEIPDELLSGVETALANMHMSEVAYLMLPGWQMGKAPEAVETGNQWFLDVVKFDSSSGDSINNSIDRHQQAIAASFLTDFLELGHHQVGARATAEVQEDPFLTAINGALLPPVIPPLNRLIDRICKLNWDTAEGSPQLKLTLNDEASLSEISAYVVPLIQCGAMQADPDLEDWLRDRAAMPPANADVRAQKQAASEAALANAAKMAESGETPGEEPPGANADPATQGQDVSPAAKPGQEKPNPNPIRGAVESTGKIPAKPKKLDMPALVMLEQDGAGCMVALVPDKPFTGVDESASQQHLTLAYLGKNVTDEQHATLKHVAHAYAATMAPVNGTVSGTTSFDEGAHVALIDAPGLGQKRAHLAGHLQDASLPLATQHDFTPHVTYSYGDGKHPPTSGTPVTFSHLVVARGGRRHKIPLTGRPGKPKHLDSSAPLSGGTTSDSGLQMVPEVQGDEPKPCTCGVGPWGKQGLCANCGGVDKTKRLDSAAAEPTVKWWERLLSQDQLRQAFDGCRDHIQAAVGPVALTAARKLADQAANGTPMTNSQPPADLVDALSKHYGDMYTLGRQTVAVELQKQRAALKRTLDDPTDLGTGVTAGSRALRARQRGEHSARNIINRVTEVLGRQQITGLQKADALKTAAEQAATGQLRLEALANTAAMVNDGRADQAQATPDVVGAVYTSVLDASTCGPCEQADDGSVLSPEDALALGPPNPDCDGSDRCRCALIWVLSDDPSALQGVT